MSKKQRRTRQPGTAAATAPEPVQISRPLRAPAREAKVKVVDFRQEYQYVIQDLKRVAIFAVALLVLLVVLAIVMA